MLLRTKLASDGRFMRDYVLVEHRDGSREVKAPRYVWWRVEVVNFNRAVYMDGVYRIDNAFKTA